VVLPLITFGIIVTTQFLMLLWSSVVLLPSGLAGTTWTRFNLLVQSPIQLYALITLALWHAPIYGWLLLVSAWARRAAILWAVLPPLAAGVLEKMAFNTTHVASLMKYRFMGHVGRAFAVTAHGTIDSLAQLTPGRFLSTPGLWIGLAFAAIFLAAAVRLRRNREPI
jgi:ABC-2 type transport system permease protein